MEKDKNLEQNLDKSNEKLYISDVMQQRELLLAFCKFIDDDCGIMEDWYSKEMVEKFLSK